MVLPIPRTVAKGASFACRSEDGVSHMQCCGPRDAEADAPRPLPCVSWGTSNRWQGTNGSVAAVRSQEELIAAHGIAQRFVGLCSSDYTFLWQNAIKMAAVVVKGTKRRHDIDYDFKR